MFRRLVLFLTLLLVVGQSAAQTLPADNAAKALAAHLDALKDVHTLEARFTCTKRLALLETPLESSGMIWINKADPKAGPAAVRFSTEKPYVSEIILTDGKVFARSQHETDWTKTNQSTRPGLTAVMAQLAAWATGDAAKLTEMYDIRLTDQTAISQPVDSLTSAGTQPAAAVRPAQIYKLTPTNKDLLKAIKEITLALDPKIHQLLMLRIVTQQGDTTEYQFFNAETNKPLPQNIFKPTAAPPPVPAPPATAPAAGG